MPTHQKRAQDLIIDSCKPTCGCWELNSGSLEEQPALLTSEPSLQPIFYFFVDSVLLLSTHGCPGTCFADQDGLKLLGLNTCPSWVGGGGSGSSAHLYSQHLGGRSRWISVSLRPAWSTERVPRPCVEKQKQKNGGKCVHHLMKINFTCMSALVACI